MSFVDNLFNILHRGLLPNFNSCATVKNTFEEKFIKMFSFYLLFFTHFKFVKIMYGNFEVVIKEISP